MTRTGPARPLAAALLAVGMWCAAAPAQLPPQPPPLPGRPALDPLAEARARQQIADQKAQAEVLTAIENAERAAKLNPAKAAQILKAAQTNIDLAVSVSGDARKTLTTALQGKIAQIEGRPLPVATGAKPDPAATAVRVDKKAAFESYAAELKAVNDGVQRFAKLKQAGLNHDADAEIAKLAKAYPNNPSVIRLQETDTFATRIDEAQAFAKLQGDRIVAANNNLMASSLPAIRDVEFPKGWKELTARRMAGVKLTEKEVKLIAALDKAVNVNWNGKPLEEALQEFSNTIDQNLFIDKKSLTDLGLDLTRPATLQANGVSARTVLRQLLGAQGLTFVVKDEAIQVVTVEKARDMLVTRVYYLGDVVQGVGPFGGALQWGPFVDFQQTQANVETIVKSIQTSIDPLFWRPQGPGTITFHYPSMSIIVRASAEVHASLGSKIGGGR